MSNKPWFLYLIECQDGSIYTGITVDVTARYAAHEKGTGARYTRSHPPKRLLAVANYPDRSAASKAEYAVKQLSAGEKRQFARDVNLKQKPLDQYNSVGVSIREEMPNRIGSGLSP